MKRDIIQFGIELKETMKTDGRTEIYGIFGWPVGHTKSPAMQNAAFEHFGLNAQYVPFPVAPEALNRAVDGVRALNIKGVNVTVPHKVEVIEYLDTVEGAAAELHAVNVIANRDGHLTGYNTDVEGFRLSLEEADVNVSGAAVTVIGAGGAGRSVLRALQLAGAAEIFLVNRTHSKAETVATDISRFGTAVRVLKLSDSRAGEIFRGCAIIINATSLGLRKGDALPVDPELIHSGQTLVDLIYRPSETCFLAAGAAKGARTVNGYGMLVFQAREAFRIWTGMTPPVEVMWNAGAETGQ